MPGFKNTWTWVVVALALGACGSKDACDRPQEYVYSKSGEKLVVPEGMSVPDSSRNREIPELSGERKERSNPCSVLPPELVIAKREPSPAPEVKEPASEANSNVAPASS